MVPKPIGHNAQKQRLTIALKNICRDYPAGGGVLRELLQNADDAGATVVRFHLDERSHPTSELIKPALAKYQGPALLAYNNAIFTPKDFQSLSRLGDSLKVHDGMTTGRFGRGFNSVYNWTDSPSIVSRDRYLILDPHEEWSSGGDLYDFVSEAKDEAIQNQMAAFRSVMQDLAIPLEGTVIRIPLRTHEQASKSDISSRETTVVEVREVLQKFAIEFGNSGLLFLRNVEKVDMDSTAGISISIEAIGREDLRKHKSKVNEAVKLALSNPDMKFDHSFEVKIKCKYGDESKETCFIVHHTIQGDSIDSHLREWTRDQKLVPWAAVAAQYPFTESTKGSLFTILPLPIAIEQPVLIHSLFSLSPDRARLYQLNEDSAQDQSSAKWNEWLLQGPIPIAWTKLLSHLALLYPDQSTFKLWPQHTDSPNAILRNALDKVMDIVAKDSLPLWSTHNGQLTAMDALLNIEEQSTFLKEALKEAQIPVVYVPDRLQGRVNHLFNGQILDPQRLCIFLLNKNNQIRDWSLSTKKAILEYILSKPGAAEYGSIELFPFKDGEFRSIAKHVAFVHRNEFEKDLFCLQADHNLDFDKMSNTTTAILKGRCADSTVHNSIRHRTSSDLRSYCLKCMFSKTQVEQDSVRLDADATSFVSKAWIWLLEQGIDVGVVSDLWLIPLTNGQHRRVKPRSPNSVTILAPAGSMGDLVRAFESKYSPTVKPLLDTGITGLSTPVQTCLMAAAGRDPSLLINDASKMTDLAEWLYQIRSTISSASDQEKVLITQVVVTNLSTSLSQTERRAIGKAVGALGIFQKVSWKVGDKATSTLTWTACNASKISVGLSDGMTAIPNFKGVQFLAAPLLSPPWKLLNELNLATCLNTVQVIEQHIIPSWTSQGTAWPEACRDQLATVVLGQFSGLSPDSQAKLRTIPMVPVGRISGAATSKFSIAEDLIDPSVLGLKELFFDDEEVVPNTTLFTQFHICLRGIGLKDAVDEDLVSSRTRYYANSNRPISDVKQRVQKLLSSSCRWHSPTSKADPALQRLKWLPVLNRQGTLVLESPNNCRGIEDKLLVSSQMPIYDIPVSAEWRKRLGWCDLLPKQAVLGQLNHGLRLDDRIAVGDRNVLGNRIVLGDRITVGNQTAVGYRTAIGDRAVVDAVLSYIVEQAQVELFMDDLRQLPFILTSTGIYVTPSKAFRPPKKGFSGCERLHPYLGNVDRKFWQDHETLLTKMMVGEKPSLSDLCDVQKVLESQTPLSDSDVAVAIEVLHLASLFPKTSLVGLKVLSKEGVFYPIQEIYFDDLGVLVPRKNVNSTHPKIPQIMVTKLGIELLSQRLMEDQLVIEDIDDEDEYEQQENPMTRIGNSLEAYRVDDTFREYLANADDAGASEINWLLDGRTHPQINIVTPEMRAFQGPALLVHNNGVFSDDDLKGFKNLGEGSKRENKNTIGKFGRGSQTMYHWTDVPMILTGKYLIILDPQQEFLTKNRIKGKRKPGIKVELSKLKISCADQLAPFEGLWGYHRDLDEYPGTIFRFALRTGTAKSKLRISKTPLDVNTVRGLLTDYFDEARISLLFLRHVRAITFKVHGKSDFEWSINTHEPLESENGLFSRWAICSFTKSMGPGLQVTGNDKWLIAIEDFKEKTEKHPYNPRRVMKDVECGIAGLVSSKLDNPNPAITFPLVVQPRVFSTLPLPILSDLPVCVHATFSLSGDRQSLIIEERGSESEWNKYLLQNALPEIYLSFLEELGRNVRQDVFRFWPKEDPSRGSCSELISSSFWKTLPGSSGRYFPKAQPSSVLGQRQRPALFDIHQAVFDFLPKSHSDVLAALLLSLGVNLVWNVPHFMAKQLKALPEVQPVTGRMLRELFRSEASRLRLQEEMSANPDILKYLLSHIIPGEDDLEELDGCHVLPLADGTLNTWRLLSSSTSSPTTFYVASKNEAKLFDFALGLLVSPSTSKSFEKVLSCGKFNVETLQLRHVSNLLKKRTVPPVATPEADQWLSEFWDYWNKKSSDATTFSSMVNDDLPGVFRQTCVTTGICRYTQRSQLDLLPAVIEASTEEHQQLSGKFLQLWHFDNRFMPTALRESESSFSKSTSFIRFLKALQILAKEEGDTLGGFIDRWLGIDDVKLLRDLIIYHASQPCKQDLALLKDHLRSISLWPSIDSTTGALISADDALIAEDSGFLVPWMKQYPRFIDPQFLRDKKNQNCVQMLGIQKISPKSLLGAYVLPLPLVSSGLDWSSYKQLIAVVSHFCKSSDNYESVQSVLSESKIAVDKNSSLRRANELFDHNDDIFTSAFRDQQGSKFLHSDLEKFRHFWLKVGLLHCENSVLDPKDYLQCLRSLSQRLSTGDTYSNAELAEDARVVLLPLISQGSALQKFRGNLSSITEERVFVSQSRLDTEPEHRRVPMGSIAAERRHLALGEVVSHRHVATCWSQTPFPYHEPTAVVLSSLLGNGKPTIDMVWKHLDHLASMAQHLEDRHIQGFLHDLRCTYTYLQDDIVESRNFFYLHKTKAIWLNTASLESEHTDLKEIKSSWNEIGDLVLSSSCDAGRIKAVRPNLLQYEKLLRALGCNSIIYPTITRPVLHHGHSIASSLRKLRADRKLLDITFRTEGKEIQAHRVVLAAISEKCAGQWSGLFPMEDTIIYDKDNDPDSFISYHTLSTMINYAYESEVDWSEMEASDDDDDETRGIKLDMLLDLHKGAQYWLIPALMSEVEDKIIVGGKIFINIENVARIEAEAEYVGARAVGQMCRNFIKQNSDAVDRAKIGSQE